MEPVSKATHGAAKGKENDKARKRKTGIEEYLNTRKAVGETYSPDKAPILAARKFNHAGKIFDVVLTRYNTNVKGKYQFGVMVREKGAITGGSVTMRLNEKAARGEYMRADASYLQG